MTTGYNIREGSIILAERRKVSEHDREVAEAMIRRAKIQRAARNALFVIDMIEKGRAA